MLKFFVRRLAFGILSLIILLFVTIALRARFFVLSEIPPLQDLARSAVCSLDLALKTLSFSLLLGLSIGFLSWRYKLAKGLLLALFLIFKAIPTFALAALLQFIFSVQLGMLPSARYLSQIHSILPALSLGLLPSLMVGRLFLSSLENVAREDYIKMAKVRGLSQIEIFFRHLLRNSIPPVAIYSSRLFAHICTRSLVVERIFLIPGLGYQFIDALEQRSYAAILCLIAIYIAIFAILAALSDLIYFYLNPALRGRNA